jgi:hypothetical protein
MKMRNLPSEYNKYLRKVIPGHSYKEITHMFNAHFDQDITIEQVKNYIKRNHLSTGRTGCFEKGHQSWCKGLHIGTYPGSEVGQFKKGSKPKNAMPIGTERYSNGYIYVKVQDGHKNNNWKAKHIKVYEDYHGPIPSGHVVIFADSDRHNFDIDNLILITRSQLARMNQNHLINTDPEFTKTGLQIAKLIESIGIKQKILRNETKGEAHGTEN